MKPLLALTAVLTLSLPALSQEGTSQYKSPVPFKGIARLYTLKSSTKNWTAESTYPTFTARTRLARFVNRKVSMVQRKQFSDWLTETKKAWNESPSGIGPYEYASGSGLSYYSKSKLISLYFASYQFMGGAHGMNILDARNFGIINGRPKQLVLGDLFKPGSGYRALVQSRIFAKLKKDPNAAWIHEGSVKKLENSQFNNFVFEPGGLRWFFNPYEVGPYASGTFEVKLSVQELGPDFRRELLSR